MIAREKKVSSKDATDARVSYTSEQMKFANQCGLSIFNPKAGKFPKLKINVNDNQHVTFESSKKSNVQSDENHTNSSRSLIKAKR